MAHKSLLLHNLHWYTPGSNSIVSKPYYQGGSKASSDPKAFHVCGSGAGIIRQRQFDFGLALISLKNGATLEKGSSLPLLSCVREAALQFKPGYNFFSFLKSGREAIK